MANKVVEVVVEARVEEDTTNSTNRNGDCDINCSKGRTNIPRPKDKSCIKCFKCKRYGHYKSKC